MTNHPQRAQVRAPHPPREAIAAARAATRLTQAEAAELVYATERAWQSWESGARPMHRATWELFQIKTGDGSTLRRLGLTSAQQTAEWRQLVAKSLRELRGHGVPG